jgi:hypothetical protein
MSNIVPPVKGEVTPDAAALPTGFVKQYATPQYPTKPQPVLADGVKSLPAPPNEFNENVFLELQKNGREKLVVTRSVAKEWNGLFVCIRWHERGEDGIFRSSKRGINLRADFVEAVAAAMLKAVRS